MLLNFRRLMAFMLIICMMICMVPSVFQNSFALENEEKAVNPYNLAQSIDKGNILHCNNWYYNQITENLQKIALQGFTAVQVSPVQGNKKSINSGAYFCDWTFYYQPVNFNIGNERGTRDDFKNLCAEAEKYGIKVIVDIVANHKAQSDDARSGSLSDQLVEPYNNKEYFHNKGRDASDNTAVAISASATATDTIFFNVFMLILRIILFNLQPFTA